MEPVIINSRTNRFRAEILEDPEGSGKYKVRYFGPGDQDRGVKFYAASAPGPENLVRSELEELETAFPIKATRVEGNLI